jgi:hypothetical protein
MPIDMHVHSKGGEDGNKILEAMDGAGLERIVLVSRPPHCSVETSEPEAAGHRAVIDEISSIVARDPHRMIGFAWVEPTLPDAADAVDYALREKRLGGIKMIPNQWHPDDLRARAVYQRIGRYGKPVLFHSGILWTWGNTSKYCRPAEYEIMMEYPEIRFAVAHIGWPWTDECLAVCGKFRQMQPRRGHEWTCYVDITTGAPPMWKVDTLRKALAYLGDEHLIYGSDCLNPESPEPFRDALAENRKSLSEAGASEETIHRVFHRNALKWLGIG